MFQIDAEKLRSKMIQANLNTKQLAKAAGISVSALQRILNNTTFEPQFLTVCRLARALNCPFDEILQI